MMKFVDNLFITLNAGNGGNGCNSYKKINKFKNIPTGGSGGNGGNIYLVSNINLYCLYNLSNFKILYAENGHIGKNNNSCGKNGKNLFINIPVGTNIINIETNELVYSFKKNNEKILIAKGGLGGLGNIKLKYNNNKFFNNKIIGNKGEIKYLQFKFYLNSDIGIFGIVNSGKSYIFKKITNINNVNISNYPFTTKFPRLGTFNLNLYKKIYILDTPGFTFDFNCFNIKNSKYLYQLCNCNILLHIIDINILYNYKIIYFLKYMSSIKKEFKKNCIDIDKKKLYFIFNKLNNLNLNIIKYKINYIFKKYNIKNDYFLFNKNISEILNKFAKNYI